MSFGRNFARLLRGEAITSASGELLGYANSFTSIVIGIAVAFSARSIGWGLAATVLSFFTLFAMLADRATVYVAAVVATSVVALSLGAVGWVFGGPGLAIVVGGAGGVGTSLVYVTIARRLSALGDDWY